MICISNAIYRVDETFKSKLACEKYQFPEIARETRASIRYSFFFTRCRLYRVVKEGETGRTGGLKAYTGNWR